MSQQTASKIIWGEISSRLTNLTEANGYNVTIKRVFNRPPFTNILNEDVPFIEFYPIADEYLSSLHRIDTRQMDIEIVTYYSLSPDDGVLLHKAEEINVDIHTALQRSTLTPLKSDEPSINLGGLVERLFLTGKSYEETLNGATSWISTTSSYSVIYKTEYNNPYALAFGA